MAKNYLRIATKSSLLAMRQAEIIKLQLEKKYLNLNIEIICVGTKSDKLLHRALSKISGKGLFAKELEKCLLDNQADVVVHSMKDLPLEITEGLCIPTILKREDHRDVWISTKYPNFDEVPNGAVVGVSSLRNQCQILRLKPNLRTINLRGNVASRIDKLERGDFDVVILAASGLDRLGVQSMISKIFSVEEMLPAVAQGAIGLECREHDTETKEIISVLHDYETSVCVRAERAMNAVLHGNCLLPVAGFAHWQEDKIYLSGLVGSVNGKEILTASAFGYPENNITIGREVAQELLSKGARELLDAPFKKKT